MFIISDENALKGFISFITQESADTIEHNKNTLKTQEKNLYNSFSKCLPHRKLNRCNRHDKSKHLMTYLVATDKMSG